MATVTSMVLATVAGCGAQAATTASKATPIVIGASIPITGTFAAFGGYLKWGYQHAVNQVNAAGGITIGGVKHLVKLDILDDESNSDVTANNVQRLILQDHVVGLLSSSTPPLVNPGALVAEHYKIPMVACSDPIASFEAAHKWSYVWDIFFYDPNLAETPFMMLQNLKIQTNHKVAIIYDNSPDGMEVGGTLWPMFAKKYDFKVAYTASFPTGTTDFSNIIQSIKASQADVVLVDTDTPTAIAIRQQMKEYGFNPKMLDIEKGAEPLQYSIALGPLANGTLVGGYWGPNFPYPGAAQLANLFEKQTHNTWSQHIADSYTAAQVLLDAIARAGSTNAAKINAAIAKTNKTYVVGPISFTNKALPHASALPVVEDQWQNGKVVLVWPTNRATGKFLYPIPPAQ